MAKHYIKTVVEFWYESENDEFETTEQAEEFGSSWDRMMSDGVYSIDVEVLPNDKEDEDDEE